MVKIFCDVCNKEVNKGDIINARFCKRDDIELNNRLGIPLDMDRIFNPEILIDMDICRSCYRKIIENTRTKE